MKAARPFADRPDAAAGAAEDLSDQLRLTVDREPGDVVRCTRVGERYYRCNWWCSVFVESFDNPGLKGGQLGTTYRVRKSEFLEVVRTDGTLSYKPVTTRERPRWE